MMEKIVLDGGGAIDVLGVIKGLFSEKESVRTAFAAKPDAAAISISPEELEGLQAYRGGRMEDDYVLSDYELMYAENLRKFGKVGLPPPCFVEALDAAKGGNVPLSPIDMDEKSYTNAYCAYISGAALVRHSLRKGYLKHTEIKARTAEEFVRKWDAKRNKIGGFRKLEDKRESHMARKLLRLSEEHKNILAVIELERADGVIAKIRDTAETTRAHRK